MKTVIIGVDGADWQVIEPLLAAGKLPTVKYLIDTGCHGVLRSTMPPHSPPAWASMITGVNPGKHGIYDFTTIDDHYRRHPIQLMSQLGVAPLWRLLNERGLSTGIVNVPILYPPESVQGYMVCGMVTPGNAAVFTYPESLSREIGLPKENWIIGEHLAKSGGPEELLAEIKAKTKRQADLVLSALDKFETNFLMVVFDGSDKVQHVFWKYWDRAHPRYDPQASELLKSAVSEFYIDLDRHLACLVERLGESDVFLVSDHGFTALSYDFYIERWLLQEGYLHLKPTMVTTSNRMLGEAVRSLWQTRVWLQPIKEHIKRNPLLNRLIKRTRDTLYDKGTRSSEYIDWSRTRVYFAGLSSQALRVNLRGREKFGIVNNGEEYVNLVEELKTRIRLISDPVRKHPVADYVYSRAEIYHGPRVNEAPDLVVVSEHGYALQEGFPNHLLAPSLQYGGDRSGGHRSEGVFIASGPDIKQLDRRVEATIVDIMPTILYLNHVPIPDYVDGAVIASILDESFQAENNIDYTDIPGLPNSQSQGYSAEEQALMEEHLRALGYL